MDIKYKIYQTPIKTSYAFRGWNDAEKNFDIFDYVCVYSGEIEDNTCLLNTLFNIFNCEHPADYHSRSMSVSDVVVLDDGKTKRYFYCDDIGWKDVTEYTHKKKGSSKNESKPYPL